MAAAYCCSGDARCVAGEEEEAAAGAEAAEELRDASVAAAVDVPSRSAAEAATATASEAASAVAPIALFATTCCDGGCVALCGLLRELRLDVGVRGV